MARGKRRPAGGGKGGRTRPPKPISGTVPGSGRGKGTTHKGHTTVGCMLAKAVGAIILGHLAVATGLTFAQLV